MIAAVALALAATALAAAAGCSSKQAALAELASADGPVERQEGAGDWRPAPIGTAYFLGDAARTGAGGAQLALAGGGGTLAMQPRTVLRFGGGRGEGPAGRQLAVELGAVELTGAGSYALDIGDVELTGAGTLRITARDGGQRALQLVVGEAQVATAGGAVRLEVGKPLELGIGAVVVTAAADAAVPPPDAAAPPPDAAEPAAGGAPVALELRGLVEVERPGGGWKVLPRDTRQLDPGSRIRLGKGATAKLSTRGVELELAAGARAAIADDGSPSLEAGAARARAAGEGALTLPGGALALKAPAPDAPAEAALEVGSREARVAMRRGTGRLSGAPGTELAMARGESAVLGRAGTIRVVDAIPTTFDFRVAAGETFTVHDPRPPTAIAFQFGGKCPGGGVIELDRDGRFRTPRASAGKDAANLRVDGGAWSYRLRCTSGGGEGGAVASGRIAVIRDAGTRALPKLRPPNDIEADGRTWRVSYQSVMPDLRVHAKGAGARFRLTVAAGGKADVYESGSSTITIPGAKLREGTYTYWVEVDGARQDSKTSTLIINFDQTAAQVYIESPQDGAAWQGDIEVRGAVLPGWTAAVDVVAIPIDPQRRFAARVGTPPGTALAIKLSHPARGVHYYLRRGKR